MPHESAIWAVEKNKQPNLYQSYQPGHSWASIGKPGASGPPGLVTVPAVNANTTTQDEPQCGVDWRVEARAAFPELESLCGAEWSVHVFLTELLDIVRKAHRDADTETLDRAYGFAKWCLDQPRRFLADAAIVSFYEHLFDDWELRHEIAERLPDRIAERVRPLWEWRLPVERLAEVDQLLG